MTDAQKEAARRAFMVAFGESEAQRLGPRFTARLCDCVVAAVGAAIDAGSTILVRVDDRLISETQHPVCDFRWLHLTLQWRDGNGRWREVPTVRE